MFITFILLICLLAFIISIRLNQQIDRNKISNETREYIRSIEDENIY